MLKIRLKFFLFGLVIIFITGSCTATPRPTVPLEPTSAATEMPPMISTPTATPEPPRLLTVCMGREPVSLFLYGDTSVAARSIRQAIYDGPFDFQAFSASPVILESNPSLESGELRLEPVQVQPGALIVDEAGQLTSLKEGVVYRPSTCNAPECALAFSGTDAVVMDQLVARFKLRPGLRWADGTPLTASDSEYSFEIAKSLFPRARADLVAHTQAYQAVDETTVEWRGLPGYQDPQSPTFFFTPLPRHAWGNMTPEELFTAEISARQPLGWGAYRIDEWTPGDHISLSKNPAYFRAAEGLPYFDHLVFRFVGNGAEALAALLAGECDYVDETAGLEAQAPELFQLQEDGRIGLALAAGMAWEQLVFGIASLDPARPALFQPPEIRQAIALCLDRQAMADELGFGRSLVPDTYVPPAHPLANAAVKRYPHDPQAGIALLEASGWLDSDGDPSTPRIAQAVPGVPDGTAFEFSLSTSAGAEQQRMAEILQASLGECGIRVTSTPSPAGELFAPGPDGPVFGRQFALAQFGWITAIEPPCSLYTSSEIPGVYPAAPKGWGGANAGGYSNPEFDVACRQARSALPGTSEHQDAHARAQQIFAEDLPALPLYLRLRLVAMRPDLCGVVVDPSAESALWNLEALDYGAGCAR